MGRIISVLVLAIFISVKAIGGEIPDSLKKVLDKANYDSVKVRILVGVGLKLKDTDPEQATQYGETALNMALKEDYKLGIARSYYLLGSAAYISKALPKSHEYFLKAAMLLDSLHLNEETANAYSGLGDVLAMEGNDKSSTEFYNKAKKIFIADGNKPYAIAMDMSIAANLGDMHLLDSSINVSRRSLEEAKEINDNQRICQILGNIGVTYAAQNKHKEALIYYEQALSYLKKMADLETIAITYQNMGEAYLKLKDYDNSEKYSLLAYNNYVKVHSLRNLPSVTTNLALLYKEKKDYPKATEWYDKTLTLKDSAYAEDMQKQVTEMQTKYETAKKEKALALQEAELKRQQVIIYGAIAFAVVVLMAATLLFINFRQIRKLNRILAEQKEELEELNAVKNKLFSAISHDLRSPLGRVTNMLYMMQRGSLSEEKLKTRTAEFVETMQQTMQMLDNLLYWAASQMRGLNLQQNRINMQELIDENISMMKGDAESKKLHLSGKSDPSAIASGDLNMIRLVVRNLINNAVKFTGEGGEVTVNAEKANGHIKISVSDTGIGMSQETINALFTNTLANSKDGTRAEKGFGLGLQLCKEFVEKNGGELKVESEVGKGSTFSFELKAA